MKIFQTCGTPKSSNIESGNPQVPHGTPSLNTIDRNWLQHQKHLVDHKSQRTFQ